MQIKDFPVADVMMELRKKGWPRKMRREWYRKHKDDEVTMKPKTEVIQNRGLK